MELTREYFDKQIGSLASKNDIDKLNQRVDGLPAHKDLANFATKDDLKKFATKDDLLRFATKDDLLELATKNDLGSVRSDIAEVKQLVQRIAEREDQDTRAILHDVADLRKRVTALERSSTPR